MSVEQTHTETIQALCKCADDLSDIYRKIQLIPLRQDTDDEYKQALIDYEVENYKEKIKKVGDLQRSFYCWEVRLEELKCGV